MKDLKKDHVKGVPSIASTAYCAPLRMAKMAERSEIESQSLLENERLRRRLRELEAESIMNRTTLYSIADGVISTDAEGAVMRMNAVAERLTGWKESEAAGQPSGLVFRLVNEKTGEPAENPVTKVLSTGKVVGLANHTVLVSRTGQEVPISDSGAPIMDGDGKIMGVVFVFRDQSDERAAQAALSRSESLNGAIIRSIPQKLFLKDSGSNYITANEAYARDFGCTPETIRGKDDYAFFPKDLADQYREDDRSVIASGKTKDIEERYVANGNEYWIHTIKAPMFGPEGRPIGLLGIFEDITDKKKALIELRESTRDLEEAQRIARLGSWKWDPVADKVAGSAEFYRLFESTPESLRDFAAFMALLHPADRERVEKDVADSVAMHRAYNSEYRVRLPDGGWRDIKARGIVYLDERGAPASMVGTCIDISERRNAERKANEEEKKAKCFLDGTSDLVTAVESDGRFAYVNVAAREFLGIEPGAAIGRRFEEFLHPEDREFTKTAFAGWLADKVHSAYLENRLVSSEGVQRYVSWTVMPQYREDGEIDRIWSIAKDMTARKRLEEELIATNKNLERSNKELEQFAYIASHDLQEPLRMVSSYTQLLAQRYRDKLDQDADDFINYAVDGALRMQRLIQDLLSYSRVSSRGKEPAPLDTEEAAREALSNLQAAIAESGASIRTGDMPRILGDRVQVVQLFQNLIGNAIKFRKMDDPPRIEISAAPFSDKPGFVEFTVSDNGIGIDPKYFERLFVIFQRLHDRQEYPGTGIGLALAKRIVNRHGGDIRIESTEGKGTSIKFTLPAALSA